MKRTIAAALASLGLLACVLANWSCTPVLRATLVANGFGSPIYLTAPAGDPRLFVVERVGTIRIVENGTVLPQPFLDISAQVGTTGEGGMLGLAFSPDYAHDGEFYVYYTNAAINSVLSRFLVDPRDPDRADPTSEHVLLTVNQPFTNHKGGTIAFSPVDGYLYWGLGDGGGSDDPNGNAQNLGTLLGKMLRLDVRGGAQSDYTIPATNPFRGSPNALPEIWALGLRNPFRFSFDRASGDLWIGDVGQSAREEVDHEPARSAGGRNYGWKIEEGLLCHLPQPGLPCEDPANPQRFTFPVYDYDHSFGCAIAGGVMYRGSEPFLNGHYLFADFCSNRIWALTDGAPKELTSLLVPDRGSISGVVAFGEDAFGQVYLVSLGSGSIHRID
jgi:glucose/arabinose dehydrogenase